MTNSTSVERGRFRARRVFLVLSTILSTGAIAPAFAQVAPAPPVRQSIDANGVDLFLGTMNVDGPKLSAGQDARQGMVWQKFNRGGGWGDNMVATLTVSGSTALVSFGGTSSRFSISGTSFASTEGDGAKLSLSGTVYTYTAADGTVAHFSKTYVGAYPYGTVTGLITDITRPAGESLGFSYASLNVCIRSGTGTIPTSLHEAGVVESRPAPSEVAANVIPASPDSGTGCNQHGNIYRIASVSNNAGYQLTFNYVYDPDDGLPPDPDTVPDANFMADWGNVTGASMTNSKITGASVRTQAFAPSVVAGNTYYTITDAMGRATKYRTLGGQVAGITRPGSVSEDVTVNYVFSPAVLVTSVVTSAGTTTYGFVDASGFRTTTVTDPLGHATVYKFEIASQRLKEVTNAVLKTTKFDYDASGRLTKTTAPEGNYSQVTYPSLTSPNITETRQVSKTPGTPADIVTTASYPASCTAATCSQPEWTKDALLNQTDYTYTSTGDVLTVTAPAATTLGVRPKTTYSYTTTSGISLLTGVSTCQTTASCIGTVDEVKATIAYNANLLPTTVTKGAGDGSLTATTTIGYDDVGNRISVDGPLAGAADTATYRYDADREMVGAISADPDGAGVGHPRRASRMTYDTKGRVTLTEAGTVTDTTDVAWAAFVPAQAVTTTYDGVDRKLTETAQAGGTTYGVTQYSYDHQRLDCTAVRMNSAAWSSLPASACTAQTAGAVGPDRITKVTLYDELNRPKEVTSAFATIEASVEKTIFTDNGQTATAADAKGNLTTYEYDGFDRPVKVRYPLPSTVGSSSTTDYEQVTLDSNGNATSRRLRDGTSIGYTYDNLNRVTFEDRSGTGIDLDVTYTYDLLGRLLTSANVSGHHTYYGYDALSRVVSETNTYGGTHLSQYDAAGRRTRLTWSDGFYVDYDHDVTGNVTAIRENGATSGVGVLASYGYDDLGRRTSVTRGNGVVTSYGYDAASRLASLTNDLAGTAQDVTTTFTYNPAGQIAGRTASNDSYRWSGAVNVDRSYSVNGLNQYASAGGVTFGYDAKGNLTSSGSTTYAYTQLNQLASAPGVALYYDPMGRLDLTAIAPDATAFSYDGNALIGEYSYNTGARLRRHVHGPGTDELLVSYDAAGNRSWLVADERGSIVAATDASGNATAIASYDEYGIPAGGDVGRFGYTGQAWIPEIGMSYYKARMYSPSLGRFMQTDPIGYADGMNWYNYVGGDPVNFVDPSGLKMVWACVGNGNGGWVCGYSDDGRGGSLGPGDVRGGGGAPQAPGDLGGGDGGDPAPQDKKPDPCSIVAGEQGAISYVGTSGEAFFGGGISVTTGFFRNERTGSTGSFTSYALGLGLGGGYGAVGGRYNSISNFIGYSENLSAGASVGPVSISGGFSQNAENQTTAQSGGISLSAPISLFNSKLLNRLSLAVTASDTHITGCKVGKKS